MSDHFQDLTLFVRVAESGSFSRAGRELGYAQPTVSRMIGGLEARLGVKLLVRTTRQVVPTEAGAMLLERARGVLSDVEEMENAVRGADGLTGVLKVATPVTFGAREIAPRLGSFLTAHPALRVELLMADRRVDLLNEGVDLAIRLGALEDSSFVSRRIASAPRYIVASPAYLAARSAPRSIADLQAHDIISGRTPGIDVWTLRDKTGGETSVKLEARLVATSTEGVLASAVAGFGLALTSAFACRMELARGELVRVLPQFTLPTIDVHAVSPLGRKPPAKARLFIDHIVATMQQFSEPI
ncbi:MAG: LysR family transcriptional regulator [Sphingomonas sp.]|nr:LysR family transcriptional regulator [Sphingomonas sp.]